MTARLRLSDRHWLLLGAIILVAAILVAASCFLLQYLVMTRYILSPTEWQVNQRAMIATHPACHECTVPIPPNTAITRYNPMGNTEPLFMRSKLTAAEVVAFYQTQAADAAWASERINNAPTEAAIYLRFPNQNIYIGINRLYEERGYQTGLALCFTECSPAFMYR